MGKVPYSIVFVRKSGRKVPQKQNSRGLTVEKRHYKAVLLRKSPRKCRRWEKMSGTFRGQNGLQILVGGNECGRCAGYLRKVCF